MTHPIILSIDTSCDDTSAAVTCGTEILSNVIASQVELHKPYGGVFPTVAKIAHKENIDATVALALKRAQLNMEDIATLAVTVGPGLAPALEVGITKAKELAKKYDKPLIPINHVEGHVLSVLAKPKQQKKTTTRTDKFPALAIIVSGKNTQFVLVKAIGEYQVLGSTLDDAAGECLDKIGRMLNLGYPAGQLIEEFAKLGNTAAYPFPLPLTTIKTYDVSFSGMKTFARNLVEKLTTEKPLSKNQIYDLCASAQYGIFRHICYKLNKVLEWREVKEVWLGGGVAANMELRRMIRETLRNHTRQKSLPSLRLRTPYTKKLCADNAAMIGVAAAYKQTRLTTQKEIDDVERLPRLVLG